MSDALLELLEQSGAYVYKGKLHLPTYTMMGIYPIFYYTRDMETLCSDCATTDYFEWLYSLNTCDGWQHDPPVTCDVYWEGPPDNCAGCNKVLESAYGDPEDNEPTVIIEGIEYPILSSGDIVCPECGATRSQERIADHMASEHDSSDNDEMD